MELLVFLLGGAFGISLSNLYLLVTEVQKDRLTEALLLDICYELASIVFIFSLLNAYMYLS